MSISNTRFNIRAQLVGTRFGSCGSSLSASDCLHFCFYQHIMVGQGFRDTFYNLAK